MDLSAHVSGIRGRLVNTMIAPAVYRNWLRGAAVGNLTRPFGRQELVLQTVTAGLAGQGPVPIEHLVYIGGPISAPGYDFHSLAGRAAASQRVEWRFPVPFPSIPLGAFGKSPATVTLAPYGNAAWVDGIGWKPSVGVGALTLFDLFRFDVARGLRGGRWSFGFDVSRTFWGIL
jgi:hypothetical protein